MAFLAANPTARPATRASTATSAVVIASSSSRNKKPSGRPLRPPARRRVWRTRRAATYKGLLAASLVPPRTSRPRLFANVSYTELVFVRISLSNSQCTAERPLVQYRGLQSTRRSGLLVDRASGHEPPQCGSGGDRKERRVGKECRSRWSPYH